MESTGVRSARTVSFRTTWESSMSEEVAWEKLEPVLPGKGESDYERYLRTDELLSLQKTPDEWVHRDELLFQTVHQSSELWLKLAWNEMEEATRLIDIGELGGAIRSLRRSTHCVQLVTDQLHVLEHMSPWEYTEVRRVLGHGSGFDSPGFNGLREVAPPLGDAFRRRLDGEGLTLVDLYRDGRNHEDLYQLAELLTELDESVTIWRVHHFKVIERIIGGEVIGTQGTPVEILGRLIHQRLYPDLWSARNRLTEISLEED